MFSSARSRDHVLLFPFMAKGHIIPLLHLSTALSQRGIKVTLLTTPATAPFFHGYLRLPRPNIKVLIVPFPSTTSIPAGCECTDDLPSMHLYFDFHYATKLLKGAFRRVLHDMADGGELPLCVISDFFFGWTRPICEDEFGIPRIVFSGMGVFSTAVSRSAFLTLQRRGSIADGLLLQGRIRIELLDMPVAFQRFDQEDPMDPIVMEAAVEDTKSWGALFNDFSSRDFDYIKLLEAETYKGSRVWLVGPVCLYPCGPLVVDGSGGLLGWLDGKRADSVVYVAFGTQSEESEEQLDEIAGGLVMSGYDFIWVVRSGTWTPAEETAAWLAENKDKGVVVRREMAPQREVLGHLATGGFLSHCGWNSTLEAASAGVPILAWPMVALSEQQLNAKYVVDEMGFGLRLVSNKHRYGDLVRREVVCAGLRELMVGEGGKKARERAKSLASELTAAVAEGGSSHDAVDALLHQLRAEPAVS